MSSKGHEYRCSRCLKWFPEPEIDKHACDPKPECPYWEDGRHCYEVSHSERWEMGGVMMGGGVIKTCRCGAAVEPRE